MTNVPSLSLMVVTTDIVLLRCLRCNTMLECVWEEGYNGDRWEPPQPGYWYSRNGETELADVETILEHGEIIYCDHEASYDKEQTAEFQAKCSQVALESEFEIYSWWE